MSPIGRIFIILNLILAAAFLGWASTSLAKGNEFKTQYESEVAAHANTKKLLDADKSLLQTQLTDERRTKEELRNEGEQHKTLASRLREDVEQARRANDQLRADITKINETLAGYNQTIVALGASKDQAIEQLRAAEKARDEAVSARDTSVTAQRDAQDKLKEAEASVANLERQLKTARDESQRLDTQLKTAVAQYNINLKDIGLGQPQIEGRVVQVDRSLGLLALNVGKDQGVQRGMTFEIYNGTIYKGQARVENVQSAMSSALIINAVPNTTIGQGDLASTRL